MTLSASLNERHERSPLLISAASSTIEADYDDDSSNGMMDAASEPNQPLEMAGSGSASVSETIINLMKTCMGTGCLALPFAAQQGGLLLFVVGTVFLAVWNIYAVTRLCQCGDITRVITSFPEDRHKDHGEFASQATSIEPIPTVKGHAANTSNTSSVASTQSTPSSASHTTTSATSVAAATTLPPPPGTATLGKVAWYALGPLGLIVVDVVMVILLFGIVVTYQDAIQSFLQDTPFTSGWKFVDSMAVAMIVAPLSCVPDMGYLAKISALGLSILAIALLVIAGYGLLFYESPMSSAPVLSPSLHWLPQDGIAGISHYFGCLAFGFGAVPLTFNFQESMAEPKKMVEANKTAMFGVSFIYIGVGIFLSFLYPNIPGDVLHELPASGVIPTVTRLAFVFVVLATTPLLLVPCAELLEGKILQQRGRCLPSGNHSSTRNTSNNQKRRQLVQVVVRFSIAFLSAAVSVAIPGFVEAISFVGCFCVALVSFCVPPTLHVVLVAHTRRGRCITYGIDLVMLGWGLAATCITTYTTLRQMGQQT